jgi:MOSC domain-containing protein YiiM
VYSREDFVWWEEQLGRSLASGIFGENLTISSFGGEEVMIGDRWQIGEVVLETTAPRIPCGKLGAVMKDPSFVKTFRQGRRPGFYARVLNPGVVVPCTEVTRFPSPSGVSVLDLFDLVYDVDAPADELRRVLGAPIAERARRNTEERLARLA